jgi:hypothetical protein
VAFYDPHGGLRYVELFGKKGDKLGVSSIIDWWGGQADPDCVAMSAGDFAAGCARLNSDVEASGSIMIVDTQQAEPLSI